MKKMIESPAEWLTDSGLTPAGEKARKSYGKFVDYLHQLPLPIYKVSRALHLMQSNGYDTSLEGYATPPHTINFCVNNRCNLHCSYCDLNHGREEWENLNTKMKHNIIDPAVKHELPLETCRNIIDQVAWFKPTIRIPWMEALLYSNLLPFIEYTKSKGLPFSMLTNGLLLPKFATRLAEAGVDALRVSLDGPGHIHDTLCGVKGAYKQIIKGLQMLVEEKAKRGSDMQIGCYYTVNDTNFDTMVDFMEEMEENGLTEEIFIGFYMFNYISKDMVEAHNREHAPVSGATVEETSIQFINIDKIDANTILAQRAEIQKRFPKARIHFRPDFTEKNINFCLASKAGEFPDSRCETHWHTMFINPDGLIKPLPQCILDPVGNINEQPFMDVWNSETMRKQRLTLRDYGAFYGCMRCWSIYSNIEDLQDSWSDITNQHAKAYAGEE